MRIIKIIMFLLMITQMICCTRYQYNENIKSKEDYEKYIKIAREGMLKYSINKKNNFKYNILAIRKDVLTGLIKFIQDNKEKLYKGKDDEWLFDNAMLYCIEGEYYKGLYYFKSFLTQSNNYAKTYFYITQYFSAFNLLCEKYFGKQILLYYKIYNKYKFNEVEQYWILKNPPNSFPLIKYFNEKDISSKIKENEEYKSMYKNYQKFLNDFKKNTPDFIENKIFTTFFNEEFIKTLENKEKRNELTDNELITFLYEYYMDINDYFNAYKLIKKYGVNKYFELKSGRKGYYFLSDSFMVFYKTKKYNDVIETYNNYKDYKNIESGDSGCSNLLFVGASYAGLGDYNKAIQYLKKALDESVIEPEYKTSYEKPFLLSTLFYLVMSEEYDKFKEIGKYDEIDKLAEQALDKYSYLFKFGPEY